MGKNECTCQRMHVQFHAYAIKKRRMYVCDIRQLLNPASSDGIMIKIPYGVGVLLHQPASHPIFSYWVG